MYVLQISSSKIQTNTNSWVTKTCEAQGGPLGDKNLRNSRGDPWVTKTCEIQGGTLG